MHLLLKTNHGRKFHYIYTEIQIGFRFWFSLIRNGYYCLNRFILLHVAAVDTILGPLTNETCLFSKQYIHSISRPFWRHI